MARFRHIDYGKMLYETLRGYFSVNKAGEINWFYKLCAACLQPLVGPFNVFSNQRRRNGLIASSPWQMGQVTNVLNYLFDFPQNRIFITQSYQQRVVTTTFEYPALLFAGEFGEDSILMRTFDDRGGIIPLVINVPDDIGLSDVVATVEQMILGGIPYTINVFSPIS